MSGYRLFGERPAPPDSKSGAPEEPGGSGSLFFLSHCFIVPLLQKRRCDRAASPEDDLPPYMRDYVSQQQEQEFADVPPVVEDTAELTPAVRDLLSRVLGMLVV